MIYENAPIKRAPVLCQLNAAELARCYASGELSPVEVTKAALAHAHHVQGALNAFTFIDSEGALVAARASEHRWRTGCPLSESDGIPATIKDLVWVDGWTVRFGSRTTSEVAMRCDAPSVALLRKAGVVFIGQSASPEFGWKPVTDSPLRGITRNPWDSSKTPGGSSGGAAVAAATGAGVFHLGTDGAGSIRVPASFTGIVGLKPSFGRVPNYPPSGFFSVSHTGPMARSVDDAFRMLRAMSGRDIRDWSQGAGELPGLSLLPVDLATLRVGYWSEASVGSIDHEVRGAVDAVTTALANQGAAIEPFQFPAEDILEMFNQHWLAGAALKFSSLSDAERALVDPGFRMAAEEGQHLTAMNLLGAQVKRAQFGAAMEALFAGVDVVISPGTAIPAFETGVEVPPDSGMRRWTEWTSFSYPLNLSGQPACVIPCGVTRAGLPIGLQIIGRRGEDARVLSVARAIELLIDKSSRSARPSSAAR